MTEATLNDNNYIVIGSIPSKLHMCSAWQNKKICMRKISQACIVLAYGKPFTTELYEEPLGVK